MELNSVHSQERIRFARSQGIIEKGRQLQSRKRVESNPESVDNKKSAEVTVETGKDEMQRYFPGLFQGKISTSSVSPRFDIQKEIAADPERYRIYEASREFQGIFINMMLKSMRSNLNRKSDMLYGGNRQDIFEDMLYDEYAKQMSYSPGFNLADEMYKQLTRNMKPITDEEMRSANPSAVRPGMAPEYLKNLSPSVSTDSVKDYRRSLD